MGRLKTFAKCHPDRPNRAYGLCSACYCRKRYEQKHNTARPYKYRNSQVDRHLLRKYGITTNDYNKMFIEQDGKCAICGEPEKIEVNGQIRALCVDHDHVTGKVRALLCTGCNGKVGIVENLTLLLKIQAYIDLHKERL